MDWKIKADTYTKKSRKWRMHVRIGSRVKLTSIYPSGNTIYLELVKDKYANAGIIVNSKTGRYQIVRDYYYVTRTYDIFEAISLFTKTFKDCPLKTINNFFKEAGELLKEHYVKEVEVDQNGNEN